MMNPKGDRHCGRPLGHSKFRAPTINDLDRWKRRKATIKFFARQRDREQKVRY